MSKRQDTFRHRGVVVRKILILCVLLAGFLPLASAHASFQSSDPPANGHANYGLTRVVVNFTEDIEQRYTNADILDLNGTSHKVGEIAFNASKHNQIILTTESLPDGLYTVTWKALSVDSHISDGTFIFGVGAINVQVALDPTGGGHEHASGEVVKDGFGRAVYFAGLYLVLGLPFFLVLVDREAGLPRSAFVTAATFGILGAAGGFLGVLFLSERTQLPLSEALATGPGQSFLWRSLLLAVGAGATAMAAVVARVTTRRALAVAAMVAGIGSLLATALGSHAAADLEFPVLSISVDALHLAMGAIWVGGIFGFLHTVWGRTPQQVAAVVLRFTPWALASVGILLITGTYASFRHLPRVSDLWLDPYGRLITLKLALLGVLILVGAYNKQILGPRLATGRGSPRFFRRVLQMEALTMVCVLAAAGVLASTPPPDKAAEQAALGPPLYKDFSNFTKTTHVVLQIGPNPVTVGVQRITISLHPLTGPIPNATDLGIKVARVGEREPTEIRTLTKSSEGTHLTFSGEDSYFTSVGTWRVYVLMQRPDEFAKLTFDVDVVAPGSTVTTPT